MTYDPDFGIKLMLDFRGQKNRPRIIADPEKVEN